MASEAIRNLEGSDQLYQDLEDVLGLLGKIAEEGKLPSDFNLTLLGLFREMVDQKSIPASMAKSMAAFGDNALELVLRIEGEKKEAAEYPAPQEKISAGERKEIPRPIAAIPIPKMEKQPEKSGCEAVRLVAPQKTDKKTLLSVGNGKETFSKNDSKGDAIHLGKKAVVAEEISSLTRIKIQGTKAQSFADILAGREITFSKSAWDNSSDEILRLYDACKGLKKILLTEKEETIPLADENKIFNLTYFGCQNCSIFIWTTDGRIILWEEPETNKLVNLMSLQGIDLGKLRCLMLVSQSTEEILEIRFIRFLRG